jgi:glycosyltransferase involved in cell wall biosynthesis
MEPTHTQVIKPRDTRNKPLIVHVIDSLGIGGAEQMLRKPLEAMTEYKHLIIALRDPIVLSDISPNIPIINLHYSGKYSLFLILLRIRQLFRKHKPKIIHSHLLLSTLICRLTKPKRVKLFTTYHSLVYDPTSVQYNNRLRLLDKLTSFRSDVHIYVSNQVKIMYESSVIGDVRGKVIYNFFQPAFSHVERKLECDNLIRLVSVGNNRPEKGHKTLIAALEFLPENYLLTIVGKGFSEVMDQSSRLEIVETNEVWNVFRNKDLYISTSTHEGFGISVVEAMAMGLPTVISSSSTFQEVFGESALYFETSNPENLALRIRQISESGENLKQYSLKSRECAKKYKMINYTEELHKCYHDFG